MRHSDSEEFDRLTRMVEASEGKNMITINLKEKRPELIKAEEQIVGVMSRYRWHQLFDLLRDLEEGGDD